MRSAILVLAVTFGACGGTKPAAEEPDDDDERASPFVDPADFEPTSFRVEVRGEGRPIIFIPGLGCPGEVWNDTVEHLGDDYQTHVLTLAGFAGTPPIDKPLSATVRKELTRYIRSRRLERPVIVGHSMGGFIAYWLAVNFPENTGPVVIVDAGPALSGDLEYAKRIRDNWAQMDDEEFARRTRFMYQGMARNRKALAPIAKQAALSDRRTLGNAVYEMLATNLTRRMKEIESPVLVVLADGYFRQRITRQVAEIPDKEIVVFDAGHFVMLDVPKAWFRALDEFLETHE